MLIELPHRVTISRSTIHVAAEIGQCHGGDIESAYDHITAAYDAGASIAKFQLLTPEAIAAPRSPAYWPSTRSQRDSFRDFGILPYAAFTELKRHCDALGIVFSATPFDLEAVSVLDQIDCPLIKIASGDITNSQLIKAANATSRPIVLSTGASHAYEIDRALSWITRSKVVLMACTLTYPAPPSVAHLARIESLRHAYPYLPVGYSDHTHSPMTSLPATALGACLLEKHFALDRDPSVPDRTFALLPQTLPAYIAFAHQGRLLRGDPALTPDPTELPARQGARRSVYATAPIARGDTFSPDNTALLRPAAGPLSANDYPHLLGTLAARDYAPGDVIQ